MQRPRRTSEFQEDHGTATKRQSRLPLRSTQSITFTPAHPGTAQRNTSKSASAAQRQSRTPLKTPQTARALFTAEKQRVTQLHNDKKWIQDATQRIAEYLQNAGDIDGTGQDFLTRTNCLKQMSVKQFVCLINHFLHFCGNRFVVGTNYVDDIVDILQRLKYPHQVNKSWLKTPNIAQSFGNVIVLLDYLLDFVPQYGEYNLNELEEPTTSADKNEFIPDLQFQAKLLHDVEIAFPIWDRDAMEDYDKLKHQTCDMLVEKSCGAPSLTALDDELDQLLQKYETLKEQRPYIAPEDEKLCERLKQDAKQLVDELAKVQHEHEQDATELKQLVHQKRGLIENLELLENEIEKLQSVIHAQKCSVEQRDAFMQQAQQLRTDLQFYENTVFDLEYRDSSQQVQHTVIKNRVAAQIQSINKLLRDLRYTLKLSETQSQLEISLNSKRQQVENLMPTFRMLREKIESIIAKNGDELKSNELLVAKLKDEITGSLELRAKQLATMLANGLETEQQCEQRAKEELALLNTNMQTLDEQIKQLTTRLEDHKRLLSVKRHKLQQLELENEKNLSKAEAEHKRSCEVRTARLDTWEANLNQFNALMDELEAKLAEEKEE